MRRALLLLVALHGGACLSSRYSVRAEALQELAAQPPASRGQRVRVVQGIGGDEAPPAYVVTVGVDPSLLAVGVASASVGVQTRTAQDPTRPSSGGPGVRGGSGRSAAWVVAAVVVAATVGVFVLAGVEGARFDGWIATSPDEPVYLDTPGAVTVLPLSALTPALAARAHGASLYEGPTPRFTRLRRAPLDRVGFTLQSAAVAGQIPGSAAGIPVWAFGGRALFGGFPIPQLGLGLLTDVATSGPETLLRVGGEAQAMPLRWIGAFVGGGYGVLWRADPTRSEGVPWFHGGAQVEVPCTTRFSVQARAGAQWTGGGDGAWGPTFSLGLSVY